tara:strand:+ start:182 stop:727 length:546 start_codon:yes stop_codon:yes gene_type:complete
MQVQVKEIHPIIIENYPYFEELNKKLKEDYLRSDFSLSYKRSVHGKHTSYSTRSENINKVCKWVISILKVKYLKGQQLDSHPLYCDESWFSGYDNGEYTRDHCHSPRAFSFVYFVSTPKGSSPLVFTTSNKKVKAEEGKVVIFPGNVFHHVPKNRCSGRIVLSGNISGIDGVDKKNMLKYT